MSNYKYTPGPWRVECGASYAYRVVASTKSRKSVKAVCQVGGFFREDREANAQLISAAPDLLEACKAVVSHHQGQKSEIGMMLQAAITKAERK